MGFFSRLFGPGVSSVDATEADALVKGGALLVDVREPREWDAGHAPKARHVPLGQLHASMGKLPADRTLVVVCRSGNRSGRATKVLVRAGYDAVNMSGGMHGWKAAGLPLVNRKGKRGTIA